MTFNHGVLGSSPSCGAKINNTLIGKGRVAFPRGIKNGLDKFHSNLFPHVV